MDSDVPFRIKKPPWGKGPAMSLVGMSAIGTAGSDRWVRDCRYWLVVEVGIWKGGALNRARLIAMFGERRAQPLAYDREHNPIDRLHPPRTDAPNKRKH